MPSKRRIGGPDLSCECGAAAAAAATAEHVGPGSAGQGVRGARQARHGIAMVRSTQCWHAAQSCCCGGHGCRAHRTWTSWARCSRRWARPPRAPGRARRACRSLWRSSQRPRRRCARRSGRRAFQHLITPSTLLIDMHGCACQYLIRNVHLLLTEVRGCACREPAFRSHCSWSAGNSMTNSVTGTRSPLTLNLNFPSLLPLPLAASV